MALVSDGFELSVTLVDKSATKSTLSYALTATLIADAVTDAAVILAALNDMTDSVVSQYRISEVFIEDALALPATAQNAEKASITLQSTVANKKVNVRVPAPPDAIMVSTSGPGNNQVNVSNAAVLAYADIFTAGGQATISDGDTVAATPGSVLSGRRVTVGSRNP